MTEDKNQFTSIYGDAEDEFEIEDVSDETLTMPTDEVRAAREEELEEEIETEREESAIPDAADEPAAPAEPAPEQPAEESEPYAPAPSGASEEPLEPYLDEELEGVSFEDADDDSFHDHGPKERTFYDEMSEMGESDAEENDDEAEDVSVLSYIGHAVLFTIPVIGTILMLVYIISDDKNPHLRHLAQIWLVTLLVIAIGACAAVTMLGIA